MQCSNSDFNKVEKDYSMKRGDLIMSQNCLKNTKIVMKH